MFAVASAAVLVLLLTFVRWAATTSTTPRQAAPAVARPVVAIQVGHWRDDQVPYELRALRDSAGGAAVDGVVEWKVNLAIAVSAQRLLLARGVTAELLPATVRPAYRADAFVSIHSDGNTDGTVSGFKVAPSRLDRSGRANALSASLTAGYAGFTGLPQNPAITVDMTDYYAFDSRRFRHTISPATPGAVIETGFLSNAADRRVIVDNPQLAARGVAGGILDFLRRPASGSAPGVDLGN